MSTVFRHRPRDAACVHATAVLCVQLTRIQRDVTSVPSIDLYSAVFEHITETHCTAASLALTLLLVDVPLMWFRLHVRGAISGPPGEEGSTGAGLPADTRRSLFSGLALKRSQTSPSTQMQHGRVSTYRGVVR